MTKFSDFYSILADRILQSPTTTEHDPKTEQQRALSRHLLQVPQHQHPEQEERLTTIMQMRMEQQAKLRETELLMQTQHPVELLVKTAPESPATGRRHRAAFQDERSQDRQHTLLSRVSPAFPTSYFLVLLC